MPRGPRLPNAPRKMVSRGAFMRENPGRAFDATRIEPPDRADVPHTLAPRHKRVPDFLADVISTT